MSPSPAEGKSLWNQGRTQELISKYQGLPELWDVNDPAYRDRGRKQAATQSLAGHFATTEAEINRKIHNLRNQMSQEVRKLKGTVNGESVEARYTGRWPFFDQLKFILPALFARSGAAAMNNQSKNKGNGDCQKPKSLKGGHHMVKMEHHMGESLWHKMDTSLGETIACNNGVMLNVPSPATFTDGTSSTYFDSSTNCYKRKASSPLPTSTTPEVYIQEDSSTVQFKKPNEPADEYDVFGQFVASELRGIRAERNKRKLKRIIQKSILDVCEQEDAEYAGEAAECWYRPTMGHEHQSVQLEQHQNGQPNYA